MQENYFKICLNMLLCDVLSPASKFQRSTRRCVFWWNNSCSVLIDSRKENSATGVDWEVSSGQIFTLRNEKGGRKCNVDPNLLLKVYPTHPYAHISLLNKSMVALQYRRDFAGWLNTNSRGDSHCHITVIISSTGCHLFCDSHCSFGYIKVLMFHANIIMFVQNIIAWI